ncbi:MAG: DUF1559 domain-containing protein [Pirellulaceae bacterium]|nr:DUF1559 domain-containing protein [Planctomycetales bacterium]
MKRQIPLRRRHFRGFTFIELLIVLAISGMLLALMMSALVQGREAARRVQCQNNLRQIGTAAQGHLTSHGIFPSGGWPGWVGVQKGGFGSSQPGGWLYSSLPYLAETSQYALGGEETDESHRLIARRLAQPLSVVICPSRRGVRAYPVAHNDMNCDSPFPLRGKLLITVAGRGDYAGSMGSRYFNVMATSEGLSVRPAENRSYSNGMFFIQSEVSDRHVTDGLSKTYLVGEKYLDSEQYETGNGNGDCESMYAGFGLSNARAAGNSIVGTSNNWLPMRDGVGGNERLVFGSAHPTCWFVVMCDGSVRAIGYDIDEQTHRQLSDRNDGGMGSKSGSSE